MRFFIIKYVLNFLKIFFRYFNFSGRFVLPRIEQNLNRIADCIPVSLDAVYVNSSVIHVMTECYETGGHSKVVERWISLDSSRSHSIFFTNGASYIPLGLAEVVARSGGKIITAQCPGDIDLARSLRKIASSFEYVILHVNPDDIVPHLAFGTEKFVRPVILFNHADHLFGLSYSLADSIAESRSWGKEISKNFRGILNSYIIGLPPLDYEFVNDTINQTRRDGTRLYLGFPKFALLIGSVHKFRAVDNLLLESLNKCFEEIENFHLVIIGISRNDFIFEFPFLIKFMARINFVGHCSEYEFLQLLCRCSFFINSYPMGGDTSLLTALQFGCPTLSLPCITGLPDFSSPDLIIVDNEFSFCEYARCLYFDPLGPISRGANVDFTVRETALFLERMNKIFSELPSYHRINYPVRTDKLDSGELYTVIHKFYSRSRVLMRYGKLFLVKSKFKFVPYLRLVWRD